MRKLVLKEANPPLEVHVKNGLLLGTDAASGVKLNGSYLEPRHAKISLVGDHVFIEDLETKNGTFVNGKKILRRALKKGDLIELGGNRLVYDEDDKPDPPPQKKVSAKAPAETAAAGTSASKGSSPAPPSRISGRQEVLRPSGRLPAQPGPDAGPGGTSTSGTSGRQPAQPAAGKVEPGSTQQKTVKIKLDGNYLDPRKSPSGKSAPAAPANPGGSSTRQPSSPAPGKPDSSRRQAAAEQPGGSSSRQPAAGAKPPGGSSTRQPAINLGGGAGGNPNSTSVRTSSEYARAAAEAMKASIRKKPAPELAGAPMRMTWFGIIGMFALLVLAGAGILAAPYWRAWRERVAAERSAEQALEDASERIKTNRPFDPQDLQLIGEKLKRSKTLGEFKAWLGEPDLTFQGEILVWTAFKGSYPQKGKHILAYKIQDKITKDYGDQAELLPVFLIDADGAEDTSPARILGAIWHARKHFDPPKNQLEAPPPVPLEGAPATDDPRGPPPDGMPPGTPPPPGMPPQPRP